MVRRILSGIPGLDRLISGGFVYNSVNLVSGGSGTGKTIFGCQFIWAGLQKGESGAYITLEESPADIKEDAIQFGWDFDKYEKKGLCKFIYLDPVQVNTLGTTLTDIIVKLKAKRVVIDSTSLLGIAIKEPAQIRRRIFNITSALKRNQECTALLISEIPEGAQALSRYGVEEYVADSIVVLRTISMGKAGMERTLEVRKMRRTDHDEGIHSIDFSKAGIKIVD